MDEFLAWLTNAIRDRWHTRAGLLMALVLVVAALVFYFASVSVSNVGVRAWIFIGLVVIGVIIWWHLTALPRVGKKKVGFGVAIDYEDAENARRIRADFVATLRGLIGQSGNLKHQFQFIEFGDWISRQLKEAQDANKLLHRSGVHFLLWGTAKSRVLMGGPTHVIDLQGTVSHEPISGETSREFAKEFRAVLPARLGVPQQSDDLFAFEFAAQHLDAVARYIVATAALFSRDYEYSEQLLLASRAWTERHPPVAAVTPISILADRTKARLIGLYEIQLSQKMREYTWKRSRGPLEATEVITRKLRVLKPDHYAASLCAATAAFVLRRDVASAIHEVRRCQREQDATWRYSLAFLIAYPGDLDAAYREYRSAFESPLSDVTVPIQAEEFIQIILEEEPDRYWLWFCLGMINHRAKQDLTAAKFDFERFRAAAPQDRYRPQRQAVDRWLREIADDLARG